MYKTIAQIRGQDPTKPIAMQAVNSPSQLPVSSYFDEALYQRERLEIFQRGPRYVGHALSVPHVGDYATLAQEAQGRVLVHTPSGIELISNVCRHRQALILQGRGSLATPHAGAEISNIVC
ncbi:MAG: choline monooxygenase, partial [Rhodoferax sp.]